RLAVKGRGAVAPAARSNRHRDLVDECHRSKIMWSSRSRPGEDGLVVEETVVWMVPLREGTKEYKGVLTLEPPNLVFTQRHDGERVELALSDVRRVRRVR